MRMKKNRILTYFALLLLGCSKNPVSGISDQNILASHHKDEVESFAKSLQNNMDLMLVQSDDVFQNGKSISWIYIYFSPAEDSRYFIHVTYTDIKLDSVANSALDGISYITHEWFDSDEALKIAEQNGGKKFRKENPEYRIEASLSEPLVPNSSAIWYIQYRSVINDSDNLLLGMNASTGEIVVKYPE